LADEFTPVLYLKHGCPFCFKLRVFLLEAGLLDRFRVKQFIPGTAAEQVFRDELALHFDKVSFPAVQVSPGRYLGDSDTLISFFANERGLDPTAMPTLQEYIQGPFKSLMSLSKENNGLKARIEA
jgi:hypothetical protein